LGFHLRSPRFDCLQFFSSHLNDGQSRREFGPPFVRPFCTELVEFLFNFVKIVEIFEYELGTANHPQHDGFVILFNFLDLVQPKDNINIFLLLTHNLQFLWKYPQVGLTTVNALHFTGVLKFRLLVAHRFFYFFQLLSNK
jgi:hypothetical protein